MTIEEATKFLDRYYNHTSGLTMREGVSLANFSLKEEEHVRKGVRVFSQTHQKWYTLDDFRKEWETHHDTSDYPDPITD